MNPKAYAPKPQTHLDTSEAYKAPPKGHKVPEPEDPQTLNL